MILDFFKMMLYNHLTDGRGRLGKSRVPRQENLGTGSGGRTMMKGVDRLLSRLYLCSISTARLFSLDEVGLDASMRGSMDQVQ